MCQVVVVVVLTLSKCVQVVLSSQLSWVVFVCSVCFWASLVF